VEGASCLAFDGNTPFEARKASRRLALTSSLCSAVARLRCGVTVRAVGKSPTNQSS
jgi:hypothetical protein